jgi:hypothetical protein
VGQPRESVDHVEVWFRGQQAPLVAHQRFAKSSEPDASKQAFMNARYGRQPGLRTSRPECTVVLSAVRPRSCSRSGGITGRPYPRRMVAAYWAACCAAAPGSAVIWALPVVCRGARTKTTRHHRRDKRKGTPEPEVACRPQQRAPVGSHMGIRGDGVVEGGGQRQRLHHVRQRVLADQCHHEIYRAPAHTDR